MEKPARSRRAALEALIASLLGAAGLWRFLTPRGAAGKLRRERLVVPVGDVPDGGALVLPERRSAIVRQGEQWAAFDLTCPHLGCMVRATEAGFACPCHGSRFGRNGAVVAGPATGALEQLEVELEGDEIRILDGRSGG